MSKYLLAVFSFSAVKSAFALSSIFMAGLGICMWFCGSLYIINTSDQVTVISYFAPLITERLSKNRIKTTQYPNLPSEIRPIPHSDSITSYSNQSYVFQAETEDSVEEEEEEANKRYTSHGPDFEIKDENRTD